jgi:hypothetical protein
MRQRTGQVVNIAIGLVVKQHDQLCGSNPPQLGQLLVQPVIEYPAIGWQIDLPSCICVCEQPIPARWPNTAPSCRADRFRPRIAVFASLDGSTSWRAKTFSPYQMPSTLMPVCPGESGTGMPLWG